MPPPQTELNRWFAEEVQPHESVLRSYLRGALPTPADVDDVVHDTYVRLLRARAQGAIRSTRALLFAIARNVVCDFFGRTRRVVLEPITEDERGPVLEEVGPGIVESVCQRDELVCLAEAIDALPKRTREVILLRKIKGMSQREIATCLGISENTVESLAAKGTRRIAGLLRASGVASEHNHVRSF